MTISLMGMLTYLWGNQYATRFEYDDLNRQLYIGYTLPEHQNRVKSVWGIMKIYYVGATAYIDRICYAEGETLLNKSWNLRATYNYCG